MDFHHALAWVTFLFNTKENTAVNTNAYVVTSVVVEKSANKASGATFNSTGATWTLDASYSPTDFTFYTDATGTTLTNKTDAYELVTPSTATESGLFIPMTLNKDVKLVVNFKMKQNSNSTEPDLEQTYSVQLNTLKTTGDEAITEWKAGYHYIYTLTFGQNVIEVKPTVTDWVDKTIAINP